jgi:hypothetical protein
MDELPRTNRSRRRSRSRSRRHSSYRSRSYSPLASTTVTENNQNQTSFMPYYQPQSQPSQPAPITSINNKSQPISYILPQAKQQFIEEYNQPTVRIFSFFDRKIFI